MVMLSVDTTSLVELSCRARREGAGGCGVCVCRVPQVGMPLHKVRRPGATGLTRGLRGTCCCPSPALHRSNAVGRTVASAMAAATRRASVITAKPGPLSRRATQFPLRRRPPSTHPQVAVQCVRQQRVIQAGVVGGGELGNGLRRTTSERGHTTRELVFQRLQEDASERVGSPPAATPQLLWLATGAERSSAPWRAQPDDSSDAAATHRIGGRQEGL